MTTREQIKKQLNNLRNLAKMHESDLLNKSQLGKLLNLFLYNVENELDEFKIVPTALINAIEKHKSSNEELTIEDKHALLKTLLTCLDEQAKHIDKTINLTPQSEPINFDGDDYKELKWAYQNLVLRLKTIIKQQSN